MEVKSLLSDVRKHYDADNIRMRNKWMRTVNEDLSENNRRWQELKGLIIGQGERIDQLAEKVETLRDHDEKALECDLSVLNDRICWLIGECRKKGYTTTEDRRRIGWMHEAYQGRGGNHGEGDEYTIFKRLPTEEEYNRIHSINVE